MYFALIPVRSLYHYIVSLLNLLGSTPTPLTTTENTVPPILSLFSAIPSSNKIVVTWAPPFESNIMIRGYILGYGAGIPDAFIETFSSSETQFTITNLKPSTIFVLKLRAFNNAGEGMSLYKDVATSVAGSK